MFKTITLRVFVLQTSKFILKNIYSCSSNRQDVDVIEEFTTQLVQKKIDKWDGLRNKTKTKSTHLNVDIQKAIETDIDISRFDTTQMDNIFTNALETNDLKSVKELIDKCLVYQVLPSFKIVDKVISFCSRNRLKDTIANFSDLVANKYPLEYNFNSCFKHYLAECYWLRGNITESLNLFQYVFVTNQYLRKKVKFMVRVLIINIITESSEGALVAVINFSESLVDKYSDYYLLSIVWQHCFLSEWFTDQLTGEKLLDKHKKLIDLIDKKIPFILFTAVKKHKPEILHRLMEILLKHRLKEHYPTVLQTLFDYRYRTNDLRSCTEIVQWSLNLEVPLASIQHEQFVSLLLGHQHQKQNKEVEKQAQNNFELKF